MIGTKVAHFEITAHLGSGGMGDVYQAADTKLNRSVAIKFLPEAFSHHSESVARFQREARVLASLNHPNIAGIYGVEEAGGRHFLIMELVAGDTLEERIARGAIPVDDVVPIAKQIAEALETAHERGIIHRDLKPANIKVRPDGTVKVLDFGLAKAYEREQANTSLSNSPTMTMAATNTGVILGTAAYMSPEQAAGKAVNKRADIWSFGVVLWEMLTGSRLFGDGETVSHILADVLRAPIDFGKIQDERLRELLQRCLDRDIKTRLCDIGEARVVLSRAPSRTEASLQASGSTQKRNLLWPVVAAAFAISTTVALWAPWHKEPERPFRRLEVNLGLDVSLQPNPAQTGVVLSPDGTRLAYIDVPLTPASQGLVRGREGQNVGGRRLFVRRLDQVKPSTIDLPDAAGATNVFFSWDSQWIAFFRNGMLYKISVEGGAAVPLAEILVSGGGDWGEDGTIVIGGNTGLWRIPQGGKPVQITKTEDPAHAHMHPRILPGGKALLYTALAAGRIVSSPIIEAVSLKDGKRKELVHGGASAQYVPSGHLIYNNNGALYAIAFDADKLETRGTAVPILDDVQFNRNTSLSNFSFSNNGTFVYRTGQEIVVGTTTRRATLDWIDASGKHAALIPEAQRFSRLRLSPDGNQLAVLISDPDSRDYWIYDLRRGTRNRITFGDLSVTTVAWTPDSRYIFVGTGQRGSIYVTSADGASRPHPLMEFREGGVNFVSSYSASAKRLIYSSIQAHILTLPVSEENGQWKAAGTVEPFVSTQFRERMPVFSPDGRWVAYSTDELGRNEVVVRAFQPPSAGGQARRWTISTNGGTHPIWSANGHELFYQEGDRVMAVSYTVNGDAFNPGSPRQHVAKLGADEEDWDLAPDGRVVAVTPVETSQPAAMPANEHTIVFLENFFDEVKRRVK
jgi:serine/threonine protein kinase/WD40 repeat protein